MFSNEQTQTLSLAAYLRSYPGTLIHGTPLLLPSVADFSSKCDAALLLISLLPLCMFFVSVLVSHCLKRKSPVTPVSEKGLAGAPLFFDVAATRLNVSGPSLSPSRDQRTLP
jgi:hypothetical protein